MNQPRNPYLNPNGYGAFDPRNPMAPKAWFNGSRPHPMPPVHARPATDAELRREGLRIAFIATLLLGPLASTKFFSLAGMNGPGSAMRAFDLQLGVLLVASAAWMMWRFHQAPRQAEPQPLFDDKGWGALFWIPVTTLGFLLLAAAHTLVLTGAMFILATVTEWVSVWMNEVPLDAVQNHTPWRTQRDRLVYVAATIVLARGACYLEAHRRGRPLER